MLFILNELKYVEYVLQEGIIGRKPSHTISLLARQYYHEKHLSNYEIYDKINIFMSECYEDYNYTEWYDAIISRIKTAVKYPLLKIDYLPISQSDMDKIGLLTDYNLQKLFFTCLCFAKYYNAINQKNNNWVNIKLTQLFSIANLSGKKSSKLYLLHTLKKLGQIEFSMKCDNTNVRVVNIYDGNDYHVYHMEDLGNQYMVLIGNGFYCAKCGKYEKQNKAKTKIYCRNCVEPIKKKQIVCIDCGSAFIVSSKNNHSFRCPECYDIYRKQYKAKKEKERRLNNKSVDSTKKDKI